MIELAKKNSSSDNISVIVVFLKDPHQIVAEHKLVDATPVTRMDFESTNGCHQYDDGLLASNRSVNDETPSPDKLHVDFNKATVDVHHHDPMDANDFYFGKNGDGDFHGSINTIPSGITSNGDADKLSSTEMHVGRSIDDDHDDFGPETDVDATDDNAISPLSPSVSSLKLLFFLGFFKVCQTQCLASSCDALRRSFKLSMDLEKKNFTLFQMEFFGSFSMPRKLSESDVRFAFNGFCLKSIEAGSVVYCKTSVACLFFANGT